MSAPHAPGRRLALWGIGLQTAPLFGLLGTIVGMVLAFQALGVEEGTMDLATSIDIALRTTLAGIVLAHLGMALVLFALLKSRYRAPWFWYALWVVSIYWLVSFPVFGTIAGVVVLIHVCRRRDEFI